MMACRGRRVATPCRGGALSLLVVVSLAGGAQECDSGDGDDGMCSVGGGGEDQYERYAITERPESMRLPPLECGAPPYTEWAHSMDFRKSSQHKIWHSWRVRGGEAEKAICFAPD